MRNIVYYYRTKQCDLNRCRGVKSLLTESSSFARCAWPAVAFVSYMGLGPSANTYSRANVPLLGVISSVVRLQWIIYRNWWRWRLGDTSRVAKARFTIAVTNYATCATYDPGHISDNALIGTTSPNTNLLYVMKTSYLHITLANPSWLNITVNCFKTKSSFNTKPKL